MTVFDPDLLDALRLVVSQAIAPLDAKIDRLETRFDTLETRFDTLETRFDTLETRFDRQEERLNGLMEHVADLTERFDAFGERLDRLEATVSEGFRQFDLRLTNLEAITQRLENELGTIETRTAKLVSDVLDLIDLHEQTNQNLRTLRREIERAMLDIGALQQQHERDRRQVQQLQDRVAGLEQRLMQLESLRGAA